MEGTCEYANVCGRDALDGHDGKCILHSEDADKDEDAFEQALAEHREEHGPNFRQMVFPTVFDFSGVTSEAKADFTNATFEAGAYFLGAIFKVDALFGDATFKAKAYFRNATFESGVSFDDATFGAEAVFQYATFEAETLFSFAIFGSKADFQQATFGASAHFLGATFKAKAYFRNATFESGVSFDDATFGAEALFPFVTFGAKAAFQYATFENGAVFDRAFETQGDVPFSASSAIFQGCEFDGDVLFSGEGEENRAFGGRVVNFIDTTVASEASLRFRYADLSHCRFLRTDLRDVKFTGIEWRDDFSVEERFSLDWFRGKEWFGRVGLYDEVVESRRRRSFYDLGQTTIDRIGSPDGPHWTLFEVEDEPEDRDEDRWREVERLYRQLKRNYEERGDFPRAGDFHIGEKEARRRNPQTHWGMRFLLTVYRALSKYGERALPAALWLAVLVFGFALVYYLSGATTLATVGAVTYPEAFIHSLEATFYPVRSVGFRSFWPQLFSIAQRVISPVLIALLALALRQRVKR